MQLQPMQPTRIQKLADSMSYCLKCEKKEECCREYCYSQYCECDERLGKKNMQEEREI
jgi:hypothetical protein